MMFSKIISAFFLLSAFGNVFGQQGSDYLDPLVAPATVYEDPVKSPQNMDFDPEANMFVAHSGWYQDRLVHYYKFRMFTPGTYPGVISPGVSSSAVPLQKIFIVSETGDFDGVIGKPVIEFHTQDGLDYSDFMVVNFVLAPEGYTEDTFRSVGDIIASGADIIETEIVLNIPVVPTGSTLQHPIEKGDIKAPISPVPVLYRGVEVWTYIFEVSDESAADFFASTRSSDVSIQRANNLVTGFEIPKLPVFATSEFVSAIPIYHVNQFSRGVVEGENGGGPNPAGMRNVIDLDRPDPGYSPLWQVVWATEMPINYMADQFSNADVGSSANGFEWFWAPMFVNCPDIGLLGEPNPLAETEFMSKIVLDSDMDSFDIIGSFPSLIMQNGVPIKFMTDDGTVVGTTETNMMGGYEYKLMKSEIPEGTMEIMVIDARENETIRSIMVKEMMTEDGMNETSDATVGSFFFATLVGMTMIIFMI